MTAQGAGDRLPAALILAGAVLFLAVFASPLFTGQIYIEDDLSAQNLPHRFFYHECLGVGDSFLWMPYLFRGFYLHGEGQTGMCHPWHWLLYRFVPLQPAFNLELLVNYPLIFAGMYLLLRRWTTAKAGALFGAFLFTFCGFCMSHYVHIMFVSIITHVPWQLLAIDYALRGRNGRPPEPKTAAVAVTAIAAMTGSQILLGHPQHVYFSCVAEGLYALFLWRPSSGLWMFGALAVAKGVGVLLGAVQLLPSLDFLSGTNRAESAYDFVMSGSLHPMTLLQALSPYCFNRRGWDISLYWDSPYLGAAAPVLAFWAAIRFRSLDRRARRLLVACAALGVLGMVLALGEWGYLYRLWACLPVVNRFRWPSRHIVLYHLALAAIAGLAFADLSAFAARRERLSWRRLWVVGLPFAGSAAITAILLGVARFGSGGAAEALRSHLAPTRNVLLGAVFMGAAAGLVACAGRGRALAIAALTLFTVADISLYGLRHLPREDMGRFIASIPVPENAEGYRIDPDMRPVYDCTGPSMRHVRVLTGYDGAIPSDVLDYSSPNALRVAGVRWRKTRLGVTPELAVQHEAGIDWVELPDALPRAWLVTRTLVAAPPYAEMAEIDPAVTALVHEPVAITEGTRGRASVVKDRPGRIIVQVDTPGDQLLVVSERHHSGWRATIEGQPAAVVPTFGDSLGCVVPEGAHEVEFRFMPRSYTLGKAVSIVGVIATLLLYPATCLLGRRRCPR